VNEGDVPPSISVVSRVAVLGVLGLFVILFAWMASTLLLPWIKTGSPPPPFTGATVCVAVVGPFAFLGWCGAHIYKIFNTHLSVEGIWTPTLRGRVLVRWSDIKGVRVKGQELRLWSSTLSIAINVWCYTRPDRVPAFVQGHLPAHCVSQLAG